MTRNLTSPVMMIVMSAIAAGNLAGAYVPWDELDEASWIDFGDAALWPSAYPINAGRAEIADSYALAFSPAGGANKAKGMNAIKFRHAGQMTGHMVSSDRAHVRNSQHGSEQRLHGSAAACGYQCRTGITW